MNNSVDNNDSYENPSLEDKYVKYINKLEEIENNILQMDEVIMNEWYSIQSLNMFKNQREYFNYMLSLPRYEKLMNLKKFLENEIIELNKSYQDNNFIPMQESISLHMEQLEQ